MVALGEEKRGRLDWEFGISRSKLLHTGWINSKVLRNGAGNYIQYLVINHNGGEYEKEYIYICKSESLAVQQKLTHHANQLYFNTFF